MQGRISLRQGIVRWALRLILQHGPSFAKLKEIILARFRELAKDNRRSNMQHMSTINLDFAYQMENDLRVPLGRPERAPGDLAQLLPPLTRMLVIQMKYLRVHGQEFSTMDVGTGSNSQVMYVPEGGYLAIPGIIKYIVYIDGRHYMAINRVEEVSNHTINIFRMYPDFPATITRSLLGALELVPASDKHLRGFFAKLYLTPSFDLIVNLIRVSHSFSLQAYSHLITRHEATRQKHEPRYISVMIA
jgi:hypothetical protein